MPLPQLPEDAEADRYLFPPSTAGTLNLAAVAAQCARLWRHLDQAFSEVCRSAAVRAYEAALRFPTSMPTIILTAAARTAIQMFLTNLPGPRQNFI
ncbi:glycoside hydrolase family 9 protein [Hyphobacterium sp. CCMP332]|uniref:glycoside hydrolase family 9 protein n=1 Tax=Hyphobacterium sp. CCMP332 TaxID=2749086 RepID=UPI0016507D31|nr:glycoside hydrolase family 9 protein [Hyphobacterium sp. CCMP332]